MSDSESPKQQPEKKVGGKDDIPENITFFGIGGCESRSLLATWDIKRRGAADEEDERLGTLHKLVKAARQKMQPGQRQKLHWKKVGTVFCLLNYPSASNLYVCITQDEDYPERQAFKMLSDLQQLMEQNYQQELAEKNRVHIMMMILNF